MLPCNMRGELASCTLVYTTEYSSSKCEESNTSRSVYHSSLVSIVGIHIQCSD